MMILFIIILFILSIYTIILYKKQNFIEMYRSQCKRTDLGIPNNIFNQLLFLDKKLDSLEGNSDNGKANLQRKKFTNQIKGLEKKYNWMANYYATEVNPSKKTKAKANAAAEKKVLSDISKNDAKAKAMYKKSFKPGAPPLTLAVASPTQMSNFRKKTKNPEGRKDAAAQDMKSKAKTLIEKNEVEKADTSGPGNIPPKQNTSVPSGPYISNNSFGGAFA